MPNDAKANGVSLSQSAFRGLSALVNRAWLAARVGRRFSGKRDYWSVFGYLDRVDYQDYLAKYQRQDVAKRIVDAPAAAIWDNPPEVDGGTQAFNSAWQDIVRKYRVWNKLERLDKLASLGSFAILIIGTDDGQDLSTPLDTTRTNKLTYLQPYGEGAVRVYDWENNPRSPDFGMPSMYEVKPIDPTLDQDKVAATPRFPQVRDFHVHKSRVIHVVQNPLENDVFGTPQLAPVFNLLDDLMKVAGGSAEMFWLSARQGLHIDVDQDMEMDPNDAKALQDEIEEYQHELRRVIRTRGTKVNTLDSQSKDPTGTFMTIMKLISGTTGIPMRILLGSEAGQLASEQDRANWAERVEERQLSFAEPVILDPLVRQLVNMRILPQPRQRGVEIIWPSTFKMSPLEQAQMMAQQARAIANMTKQTQQGHVVTLGEAREILGLPAEMPSDAELIAAPGMSGGNDDDDDDDDNDPDDPDRQRQDQREREGNES